jgi:hypothetical protein
VVEMSLSLEELTQKVRSGEVLSQGEILEFAEGAILEADLNLILYANWIVDEGSESIPDFQRHVHIACLQRKAITEELISQILENALDDGDFYDVFPYWCEVIELCIDSKKLSAELVFRLLDEILLQDYDEEVPEMQLRLIEKLTANFDIPDEFTNKIKKTIKNLRSSID